jgi:hypothetical protein
MQRREPGFSKELPDLSDFDLSRADLSLANLRHCTLINASFDSSDLEQAELIGADLSGASFRYANLKGALISGAKLIDTRGLFGPGRAKLDEIRNPEWAVYARRWDKVGWSVLRSIGTLRLFGVSYAAFIVIVVYAFCIRWYNEHAANLPNAAERIGVGEATAERVSQVPVPAHLGWQLLALGLLAIGATLYAAFCPNLIKENTETKWVCELKQSLVEYRCAAYSRLVVRYVCAVCYSTGGVYTLCYLAWRGYEAVRFLLAG